MRAMTRAVTTRFEMITTGSAKIGEVVAGFYMGLDESGRVRIRNPEHAPYEAVVDSVMLRRAVTGLRVRKIWICVEVLGVERMPGDRNLMRISCMAFREPPLGVRGRLRRMGWRL